jgi:hypothetical protein
MKIQICVKTKKAAFLIRSARFAIVEVENSLFREGIDGSHLRVKTKIEKKPAPSIITHQFDPGVSYEACKVRGESGPPLPAIPPKVAPASKGDCLAYGGDRSHALLFDVTQMPVWKTRRPGKLELAVSEDSFWPRGARRHSHGGTRTHNRLPACGGPARCAVPSPLGRGMTNIRLKPLAATACQQRGLRVRQSRSRGDSDHMIIGWRVSDSRRAGPGPLGHPEPPGMPTWGSVQACFVPAAARAGHAQQRHGGARAAGAKTVPLGPPGTPSLRLAAVCWNT